MKKDIYAVIPAHNEAERIVNVIREVKEYIDNIIVVDDGSKDDTYNTALGEGVFVLRHIINLGKGAALKTGCDFALNKGAEKFIFRYDAGSEDKLLDALIQDARDERTDFDWFDAAVLSFKLTQSLIGQADELLQERDHILQDGLQ